ncbi:uncharacterized protein ATNIH1004_010928 [Aspergillus tanneri]|uniref:Secreted protein n=1 Tax=Aspergillus tanneri TaxID=1220188 RepID=A0A5M9MBU0_9EURO|nr:uncharacterized protein ATNIH1004_010928 [Aspergillus tanneri]KAA8641989.1 hypothetical protein ATNIH1004_010928 [Aspergillus tanneri]
MLTNTLVLAVYGLALNHQDGCYGDPGPAMRIYDTSAYQSAGHCLMLRNPKRGIAYHGNKRDMGCVGYPPDL